MAQEGGPSVGWRWDLLLGGVSAAVVGCTVLACLYIAFLAPSEALLPPGPSAPQGRDGDVVAADCDVTGAECVTAEGGALRLTLQLRSPWSLPLDAPGAGALELRLPLPECSRPDGERAATAQLLEYFGLELAAEGAEGASRCVLSPAEPGGTPTVQLEVLRGPGTL